MTKTRVPPPAKNKAGTLILHAASCRCQAPNWLESSEPVSLSPLVTGFIWLRASTQSRT